MLQIYKFVLGFFVCRFFEVRLSVQLVVQRNLNHVLLVRFLLEVLIHNWQRGFEIHFLLSLLLIYHHFLSKSSFSGSIFFSFALLLSLLKFLNDFRVRIELDSFDDPGVVLTLDNFFEHFAFIRHFSIFKLFVKHLLSIPWTQLILQISWVPTNINCNMLSRLQRLVL